MSIPDDVVLRVLTRGAPGQAAQAADLHLAARVSGLVGFVARLFFGKSPGVIAYALSVTVVVLLAVVAVRAIAGLMAGGGRTPGERPGDMIVVVLLVAAGWAAAAVGRHAEAAHAVERVTTASHAVAHAAASHAVAHAAASHPLLSGWQIVVALVTLGIAVMGTCAIWRTTRG